MRKIISLGAILSIAFVLSIQAQPKDSGPIKVEIVQDASGWKLLRGGEPYEIRGAGGDVFLDDLVEINGNSIRTWSIDDAEEVLDKAHKKGLSVMMGLWVGHERHGFDYNDEKAVQRQLDHFRKAVMEIKDHPALLLWGVGNEVDLFYSNTKVWDAVQDIAAMIHEVDPNHPTATVTAGLEESEVKLIMERAPDIDIYSFNTYGEIAGIGDNLERYGWNGPYIVAEWGPTGHWEVSKTSWGVPVEQSSTEKAKVYRERYTKHIKPYADRCVGSYVFLWGHKQETTSTWYGLYTAEGNRTEVIDELEMMWKGSYPQYRPAKIQSATIDGLSKGADIRLSRNKICKAEIDFTCDSKVKVSWEITKESDDIKAGGDKESAPPPVLGLIKKRKERNMKFRAPNEEGAYRLFVTITTKEDKVSYINIPFFVDGLLKPETRPVFLKPAKLDTDA